MSTHVICPVCKGLAGSLLDFASPYENVPGFRGSLRPLGDIVVHSSEGGPSLDWRHEHTLIAAPVLAPADEGARLTWHIRVTNLTIGRGEAHALLCHLDSRKIKVVAEPPESFGVRLRSVDQRLLDQSDREESKPGAEINPWVTFSEGRWSHRLPAKPGLYPVRGAFVPDFNHSVKVVRLPDGDLSFYLDDGRLMDPSVLSGSLWFWTAPMPDLPTVPQE